MSKSGIAQGDFGDFVRNEDEELDLEEIVEPWQNYDVSRTPNVFYPICLGEVLHERYLVEHKLGYGGGSTVWMAHDLQEDRDVALKVMALGGWGHNDIRMQHEIIQNVLDTSHLVTYLANFLLPGQYGQHRVLVLPLVGQPIDSLYLNKIPMASRMSAARQLLEALEKLHNAGIVHRDLNESNCMWGMLPLQNLTRSAKYEALGRPLRQKIPFVDLEKKGELVGPVKIPQRLRTDNFYLGDFGLAKKLSDSETACGRSPPQFCSPERLHGEDPTPACDMWSYMTIFSALYTRFPPFSPWGDGGATSSIVKSLGPFPERWKASSIFTDSRAFWYDQSQKRSPHYDLASEIARLRPDADPVERQHVLSIMTKVFTYNPEKRPTATELLRDPSFRAIMDNYGC